MKAKRIRCAAVLLVVVIAVLALAACGGSGGSTGGGGSSTSTNTVNGPSQTNGAEGNIKPLCGNKPLTVGFLISSGGDAWDLQTGAEFKAEAAKCPNIKKVMFAQAINNQSQALSQINSYVSLGVKALVISPELGPVELPEIRKATQAGVKVVTILGNAGGSAPTDFVDSVNFDDAWIAQQWVAFLHKELPQGGKFVFLGGTPSNATSTGFYAALMNAVKKYPNLKPVTSTWVVTNWDPSTVQQQMTDLLAKNGRISAVISDYNAVDTGVPTAYKQAGYKPPVMASITPDNALGCQWRKDPYPLMTMGQTSSMSRLALRKAVAAVNGIKDPEPSLLKPTPDIYTPGGTAMPCDSSYPPDADLTADLTKQQMKALFH